MPRLSWPRQSDALDKYDLLDEVRALWNTEADADEHYHGIYVDPWPGNASWDARTGGVADRPGWVGVSQLSPTLHDSARNWPQSQFAASSRLRSGRSRLAVTPIRTGF